MIIWILLQKFLNKKKIVKNFCRVRSVQFFCNKIFLDSFFSRIFLDSWRHQSCKIGRTYFKALKTKIIIILYEKKHTNKKNIHHLDIQSNFKIKKKSRENKKFVKNLLRVPKISAILKGTTKSIE